MTSIKKENADKQMAVMVQPSLYELFESKCSREYRNVSEVIREMMSKYIKGWQQLPQGANMDEPNTLVEFCQKTNDSMIQVFFDGNDIEGKQSGFVALVQSIPRVGEGILFKGETYIVDKVIHSLSDVEEDGFIPEHSRMQATIGIRKIV